MANEPKLIPFPNLDDIETICENSYRNFHTRGLDYLCLSRSPQLTIKVYFFDGDLSDLPEIVVPHNHRYDFLTTVLSGEVGNKTYWRTRQHPDPDFHVNPQWPIERFERFDYLTPLNGGDGFTWKASEDLIELPEAVFGRNGRYISSAADIHTLNIRKPGSVIQLHQYDDKVPLDQPTQAWKRDKASPSLDGLYDRMTPDHAQLRLAQYQQLIGGF